MHANQHARTHTRAGVPPKNVGQTKTRACVRASTWSTHGGPIHTDTRKYPQKTLCGTCARTHSCASLIYIVYVVNIHTQIRINLVGCTGVCAHYVLPARAVHRSARRAFPGALPPLFRSGKKKRESDACTRLYGARWPRTFVRMVTQRRRPDARSRARKCDPPLRRGDTRPVYIDFFCLIGLHTRGR